MKQLGLVYSRPSANGLLFENAVELPIMDDMVFYRYVPRLHTILTSNDSINNVPKNLVARCRIAFFSNSLFMNIPRAPQVEKILAFSILTPYYNEEVLYGKEQLCTENEDDISIIFYLQKISADDWGSFGNVRMVQDRLTKNEYACKSIEKIKKKGRKEHKIKNKKPQRGEDPISHIRTEYQILFHLAGGPHVVVISDVIEESTSIHLIMELCRGGNLANFLPHLGSCGIKLQEERRRRRQKLKNMNPTEDATRCIFWQIMRAIEFCHAFGVMHRDLKLDNIVFVEENQEDVQIRLIDFGLSTFFKPGEIFRGGVGVVSDTTPEVIRNEDYDSKLDLWSAGIILYTMLSGSPPFWAGKRTLLLQAINEGNIIDYSTKVWDKISDEAKSLLSNMLKEEPEERISAPQVLQHPWFVGFKATTDIPFIRRMQEFVGMSMFKRAAIKMITDNLLINDETIGLQKVFHSFGDEGTHAVILTFDEMKNGISKWGSQWDFNEMDQLLHEIDFDGDLKIKQSEFIAATVHLNRVSGRGRIEKAFRMLDLQNRGYIYKDDLKKALQKINLAATKINEIINQVYDTPKVKRLSFEDFKTMMG